MPVTVDTPLGPFRAWALDDITKALRDGAWWDGHLNAYIDATPGDGWAVDLGANIGWFTVYLAQRFNRVLAVEAHPETAQLLNENCHKLRQLDNVSIVARAAYDRPTTLGLATTALHGWPEVEMASFADLDQVRHVGGFTFVEPIAQQHVAREWLVETVCVDDLVPVTAPVRLVKVDVQGSGLRALEGMYRTIHRCRPRILLEYECGASALRGDGWPDYERFFADLQYTVTRIDGPWDEYVCDPVEVTCASDS